MADERPMSKEQQEMWRRVLTYRHPKLAISHRLFRYLPGPPRCKICYNPFGGIGGKIVGLMGFRPSRKNPLICCV
jgi:adenylate cyclase